MGLRSPQVLDSQLMRTEPLLPHCQPFLTGPGGDQRQVLLYQGTMSNRLSNKALKSPFAN